ncbi:tetratricopeptide repeat protein [Streptomyces inhibens]|uniref:tetratricopeptide repeat protein n=1 Tax=Streptomyces inhibens TaxID=2293571 RepID=UPI001EE6EC57|nr:tetratricopeptide repeat protein [Streptomyces inhibens]UKY54581.1 tetratricopeptide repeat protein [Streptomyces inhibens]
MTAKDRGEGETAERWYRSAAERDGDCAFGLANFLEEGGDLAGAAEWYRRGAALGSLACKTNGAVLLARSGRKEEAREQLWEAADAGDHIARHALDAMDAAEDKLIEYEDELAEAEDAEEAFDALEDLLYEKEIFRAYPWLVADAEALYEEAAELGCDHALVDHALLIEREQDRFDEADALLLRAHARGSLRGTRVFAVLRENRGETAAAEEWYLKAAEGGDGTAQWNLGLLYKRQRRLDEAYAWIERSAHKGYEKQLEHIDELRDEPDNVLAPDDESRLLALRPRAEAGDAEAATELADLLAHKRDLPEAIAWYERAFAAGHAGAGLALGRTLKGMGTRPERLLEHYRPATESPDLAPEATDELGQLYLDMDDEAGAERWLRRAARLGSGSAAWWCADRSDDYGDQQEALRLWRQAAEAGHGMPAFKAGRALLLRGDAAEAEPLLRLAYEEDVPEGAYWLGRTFRELGRLDDAVTWLRTAVDIHGYVQSRYSGFMLTSLFDPRIELAELLCEREADDECREQLDVVLERSPRHRTAHRLYAQVAARQGDAEAARAHLRQAGVEGVEELDALDRPGVGTEEVVRIVRAAANGCW